MVLLHTTNKIKLYFDIMRNYLNLSLILIQNEVLKNMLLETRRFWYKIIRPIPYTLRNFQTAL